MNMLSPVSVTDADVAPYREQPTLTFRTFGLLVSLVPRGKVMLSKLLGRAFPTRVRGVAYTSSGAALAVNHASADSFGELVKWNGSWDKSVRDVCVALVQPGDVFYDVGANIGYMSVEVAASLSDAVEVVAFEPQPELARTMALSVALNGFRCVSVFAAMIGRNDGRGMLFLTNDSIHASAVARRSRARPISCPLVKIDTLIAQGLAPPPQVMKVDVEGGEMDVFAGAELTIRRHRPIIVFEADGNSLRFGHTPNDLLVYLRSLAEYRFYDLAPDGALTRVESTSDTYSNIVAIHEESWRDRLLRGFRSTLLIFWLHPSADCFSLLVCF